MLSQFTVRQKLLAGFTLVITLMLMLLFTAISNMQTINSKMLDITQDRYPKIALTSTLTIKTLDIGRQIRNAVIYSAGDTEEYLSKVNSLNAEKAAAMEQVEKLLSTAKGKALFASMREKNQALQGAQQQVYPLIRSHKTAEAADVVKQKIAPANAAYMASLKEFADFQEGLMQKAMLDAASAHHNAMVSMLTVGGIALLLAIGSALFIARLITLPLKQSARLVEQIRNGNLAGQDENYPPARDEAIQIARGIQEMRQGLRDIVQAIQLNAHNVSDSASELSSMAEQVASGAQHQAEATAEAAATIEQLTVSINHVADNSDEATRQSRTTGSLARDGGKEVIDSVTRIKDVSQAVSGTSSQMNMLSTEVQQIGSIVTVIRDVADQTNLLALNAAIEAARAGEMGRGFAVVADEVRKLAERTTSSAQEITQMVNAIQHGVGRVVGSMNSSLESVEAVSSSTELASQTIERIGNSTQAIERSIANITGALSEQRVASQSLAQNMERVSQMAEENSATVEELATTSAQLSALSHNLQDITARFHL
ncbi:methyl-accepting chemotaxis protein [Aquitalea sp. LB_tupeE]|uniref:methyl-accepting chemotaxis protein n=1 Tax=Aquitalea sp. LB_tupeE TaxID=2748078 RepID=UPI0015BDD921|nr:methyl-accepting chemotaxis protein [Aquitalea sp. LB_tupeE]NWK80115.1 methyl-accepting chemotaxis protein [Aquitalea sp. LB_tupeE]